MIIKEEKLQGVLHPPRELSYRVGFILYYTIQGRLHTLLHHTHKLFPPTHGHHQCKSEITIIETPLNTIIVQLFVLF